MTLQELRYLVAVADKRHFVRAAEACHVGQPTLSTQLKKLEEHLGVTLFERDTHHLLPTPIGTQIIAQARIVLEVLERIRELARQGQDAMAGALRVGVIPTLGAYLMPHLLAPMRRLYPQLRLFLREDLRANLLAQLHEGKLDALLLALPVHAAGLEVVELFREAFVVALPAGHRLAEQPQVRGEQLAGERLLLLEEGHCLREQALAICAARPPREEELKACSLETLRQLVAAGEGCALLPALAALPGTGSLPEGLVQARAFVPPVPSRTIALIWRHRYPSLNTIKALMQLIGSHLPSGAVELAPALPPRLAALMP